MIQEFGDSTQVRPDVQTLIAFIVTLQLRVTVGSIRNSWNVFFKKLFIQLLNHLLVDNIGHVSLLVRHHIIYFVINLSILREAPRRLALHLFGHCPNSDYTPPPPPHSNGHSGALFFRTDLSKFAKSPFWRYISAQSILASLNTLLNTSKCPF